MKKIVIIALMILFGFSIKSCADTNLTVILNWTAVGDDGNTGTCSFYDVRYSTDSLTLVEWLGAVQVDGEPLPQISGTPEQFSFIIIGVESETKYYFAVKAGDEVPNWSGISSIPSLLTKDNMPPAVILNLTIGE